MTDKIVLFTTCDSPTAAQHIARSLVEQRLAACVNVLPPVQSVYRWKGQVESATEYLLLIKSRRELLPALQAAVQRLHSYEVPELIALPIVDGLPEYLAWLERETALAPAADI